MPAKGTPERSPRILVIDDEEQIRRALRSILQARHYTVDLAATGAQGLEAAVDPTPDLIVLDLTLPDMSGLEVAEELRAWYEGPIVVLSVRDADADKIAALDLGADDYLTKPFSAGRAARAHPRAPAADVRERGVDARDPLRRARDRPREAVRHRRWRGRSPDPDRVRHPGLLARNADRVVTSRMLLEQVWGPDYVSDTQTLRVHVSHLRQKIEPAGGVRATSSPSPGSDSASSANEERADS